LVARSFSSDQVGIATVAVSGRDLTENDLSPRSAPVTSWAPRWPGGASSNRLEVAMIERAMKPCYA
jgi:hypothetical protein